MKAISGKLLAASARLSAVALLSSFAYIAHAGIAAREYLDLSKWDVGNYVQEGLVLHYDGVRNVGADAEHSEATDTWVNLASDGEYPLGWYSWIKRDGEDKYDRKNGDTFVILDPRIRLENLSEVQQQVVALLSGTKSLGEVAQEEVEGQSQES